MLFKHATPPRGDKELEKYSYFEFIAQMVFKIIKGAPALESRTEGRLVSPTAAAEKKNVLLIEFGF